MLCCPDWVGGMLRTELKGAMLKKAVDVLHHLAEARRNAVTGTSLITKELKELQKHKETSQDRRDGLKGKKRSNGTVP